MNLSIESIHSMVRAAIFAAICVLPLGASAAPDIEQILLESQEASSVDKPVDHIAEKAAEETVKKVAEGVVEQTMEKAAELETAKEVIKATRPEDWKGPTKVTFLLFVIDIDEIDDANQNFSGNVFMFLSWKDRRLASSERSVRQIPLDSIWNPQVFLANQQGLVSRSLPEIVQVHPDGTVNYRQRYTGKLSQSLKLKDFPMDKHWFTIQFASAAYNADELEFVPGASRFDKEIVGGSIAKNLSLPDWEVVRHETLATPYQPIKEIRQAGFLFQFEAKRFVMYYLWQILLPLTMVVVMSWAGFWVQRTEVGVRIGVVTSSILTLIAHRFVIASLLPRLPYMTRLDYFTVGCTLLVFLALIGVVITTYLSSVKRDMIARRIDQWSRSGFPLVFSMLLIWFTFK